MPKKILAAVLFAVLLLTVGCVQESEHSDAESSSAAQSSLQSAESSIGSVSIFDETTSEESLATGSEAIELPPAPVFILQDDLRFCPAEGWEETQEHVYSSADGKCSVRADFLTLPDPKGITETLLVADALQTLPDALAQTGAEIVVLESVALTFLGTEHPSVSLVTVKDGKTVYQQQIYLLDGGHVLLLTVTSQTEDHRDNILSYFKQN